MGGKAIVMDRSDCRIGDEVVDGEFKVNLLQLALMPLAWFRCCFG